MIEAIEKPSHVKRAFLRHPVTGVEGNYVVGKTGKVKLVLSGSNQATEASCPSRFLYSRMYQNPKYPNGHAADVGTCLHEAYQAFLRTKSREAAFTAFLIHYPWHTDEQPRATYRQFEDAYITLREMLAFNKWPNDMENAKLVTIHKKDGTERKATEINFEIYVKQDILPEFDVYISGAMDMVMRSETGVDRTPFVCDLKTTRDRYLWTEKFEHASQCFPYHIVLSHILGEEINEFTIVYVLAYISLKEPEVVSVVYHKNAESVNFYLSSFVLLLHKLSAQVKLNHWPRNPSSCIAFKSLCHYHSICAIDRTRGDHIQDLLLGTAEPYDRYNTPDRAPDFELEITL